MTTKRFGLVVCLLAVLGLFSSLDLALAGEGHDHGEASAFVKCPVMGEEINFAMSVATDDGPVRFATAERRMAGYRNTMR